MTENNDKLLEQFFASHRQDIADNGFSRRVIHRLPNHGRRLSQLWSVFCFTLTLVVFYLLDGVQVVWNTLQDIFNSLLQNGAMEIDFRSLIIATVVLVYLGCRKITSLA